MTIPKILQVTRSGFKEFLNIWLQHKRNKGLGALVFMSEDLPDEEDEIRCEYWTLGELRNYVRRMEECDEVIYKWLKRADGEGGYPIVIFSPTGAGGNEQLHFSVVTGEQVS